MAEKNRLKSKGKKDSVVSNKKESTVLNEQTIETNDNNVGSIQQSSNIEKNETMSEASKNVTDNNIFDKNQIEANKIDFNVEVVSENKSFSETSDKDKVNIISTSNVPKTKKANENKNDVKNAKSKKSNKNKITKITLNNEDNSNGINTAVSSETINNSNGEKIAVTNGEESNKTNKAIDSNNETASENKNAISSGETVNENDETDEDGTSNSKKKKQCKFILFLKSKTSKLSKTVKDWIKFFSITAIVVLAFYCIFNYVPYFVDRTYYVVVSGSMSPIIKIGDVAIINKNIEFEDLKIGDIIAFHANINLVGEDEIVIHFISDIEIDENGKYSFHTMRYNDNPQRVWDSWEITEEDFIGILDFKITYVGKFLLFSETTLGKVILFADILIIFLIFDIAKDISKNKNKTTWQQGKRILLKAEKRMNNNKLALDSVEQKKIIDFVLKSLYKNNPSELEHSKRVCDICELIASKMNMTENGIKFVKIAGLLHDIGKIEVNEKILNKPSGLDEKELQIMQKHSKMGFDLLNSVKEFSLISKYILEHHERWDGNGYPNKLKGDEISLQARIISIADSYDAMISDRPYKKGMDKEDAIKEIIRCSGTQFDPKIVKIFVSKVYKKVLKNGL